MSIKITLNEKERVCLYAHLNNLMMPTNADERKLMTLWAALGLDAIGERVDAAGGMIKLSDYDTGSSVEIELRSADRNYLIEQLEKPKVSWVSRVVYPISVLLRKSRDGEIPGGL